MKTLFAALALVLLAACAPALVPATPPPMPVSPSALASPTLGASALPSAAPTSQVTATAPNAVTVQQRVPLRELPGAGRRPVAIAVLGDKVYTANSETNNLAVIQENRVVRFIPVGSRPSALAADAVSKRLYVANNGDKSISLVENDKVTLTSPIGEELTSLLVLEGRLFAGSQSKPNILVLDPASLAIQNRLTMADTFGVINLAADPVHHRLYADLYEKTAVIDSSSLRVLNTLPLKGSYYTLVPDPFNDRLLVSIYDRAAQSDYLVALEPLTGKETGRVKIGNDSHGGVITGDGYFVYVANSYTNDVSVISPQFVSSVMTIPVGLSPVAVALDDTRHRLYVANSDSHSVNVLNTENQKLEATIPLAMFPTALETNESTGRVYIANASTDSVFVLEGSRVVKEIAVGHHPIDLARDALSNQVYVANRADGTLSVINELDYGVRATLPITRMLSTVALDTARARILTSGVILDKNTLAPLGPLLVRGYTLWPPYPPDFVRVDPNSERIYVLAWNGTPGSNSREILYAIDAKTLEPQPMAGSGNVSAIVIDAENGRVYSADTHPLANTSTLLAFDANDRPILSLPLPGRTLGMALNPQTHHLFLSHASTGERPFGGTPVPADNLIEVLHTQSWGLVATLTVQAPGKMARLGNTIYVVGRNDGAVSMIQDADMSVPPSPTPTRTPTPWPTSTPTAAIRPPSPTPTIVHPPTPLACAIPIPAQFATRWNADIQSRTGCPTQPAKSVGFAMQPFEGGTMFWRSDERHVYVLFSDKSWSVFDDNWTSGLPDDSCPSVSVRQGAAKPRRGFGKVWCDQANVRAKIGAATANESGGDAAPALAFERGLLLGTNQNIVWFLFTDGKWQ